MPKAKRTGMPTRDDEMPFVPESVSVETERYTEIERDWSKERERGGPPPPAQIAGKTAKRKGDQQEDGHASRLLSTDVADVGAAGPDRRMDGPSRFCS